MNLCIQYYTIQYDYHIGVEKRNDILFQILIQHNWETRKLNIDYNLIY